MKKEHPEQKRIKTKIAPVVIEYLESASTFYADALRRYVISKCGMVAPESTGRCLRRLREEGKLNYEVISPRDSYYRVIPIEPEDNSQLKLDL